jgi:hypothetical protein
LTASRKKKRLKIRQLSYDLDTGENRMGGKIKEEERPLSDVA